MGLRISIWVSMASMAMGCASGVMVEDFETESRRDFQGYACDATVACGAGLDCMKGICIRRCSEDLDCGESTCLPLPDGDGGWCSLDAPIDDPSTGNPVDSVSMDEEGPAAESEEEEAEEEPGLTLPDIAPPTPSTGDAPPPSNDTEHPAESEPEGDTIHGVAPPTTPVDDEEPAPIVAEPSEDPVENEPVENEPVAEPTPEAPEPENVEPQEDEEPIEDQDAPDGVTPLAPPSCDEARANQSLDGAVQLAGGEQIEDAICNGRADFYRVSVQGFWLLQLAADQENPGLSVYLWDAANNAPAIGLNGEPIASVTRFQDQVLAFLGEQIVVVVGPDEARAAYELSLFAL